MLTKFHFFHIVDPSPWPLLSSISVLVGMVSMLYMFKFFKVLILFYLSFVLLVFVVYQWWRDVIRESTFQGCHSVQVTGSMKIGMILFILSELMFFVSFFWSFFHVSLSYSVDLGSWPPMGVEVFNPMEIPLLNTMILLSSGVSITWGHHMMLEGNFKESLFGMTFTVILGVYFFVLQMFEYFEASFSFSDSVYGSVFFIGTGFHGLHVMIGTLFILVMLLRHKNFHFSYFHHFGFEAACWYWHFVDFVWLFLYICFYWWGG